MLFAARSSLFDPNEFVVINTNTIVNALDILARAIPEAGNHFWLFHEDYDLEGCINYFIEVSASNKKYVLERLLLLPVSMKVKMPDGTEGLYCKKCKQYYPHSEPNQVDGSLICYECRFGLVKREDADRIKPIRR